MTTQPTIHNPDKLDPAGRVWVMGSGTPTEAAGNGKHYRNCHTFVIEPRIGTLEELATLKVCGKCGMGDTAASPTRLCPEHHTVLLPNGECPYGH